MSGLRRSLDREWDALSATPAARHRLRVWRRELGADPAGGWGLFLSAYGQDIDLALGVLARRAGRDQLAARVLLRRSPRPGS